MPQSQIYNEDNLIAMKKYPDNYFAVAFIDAPYSINMSNLTRIGKRGGRQYTTYIPQDWDKEPPPQEFWQEIKRIIIL